ncbi:MAG: hypothetical protein ORN54_14730 [Cyclobacteriaceae bacterium]|nr:hypothetical protein [Cyclobacteriaceae bacterium]
MSNYLNEKVIVVGTGPMAVAHVQVLKELGTAIDVVGRGEISSNFFEMETGIKPHIGGIEKYLEANAGNKNDYIIIAVGIEMLMPVLIQFINRPFRRILIEKPAAISSTELLAHEDLLKSIESKVFVAYNRRFYASVAEVQKMIQQDGGLLSIQFEFTEWPHKIEPLVKAPGVKENWFFANSTHVIDLAFFMAGAPAEWRAYSRRGKLEWHPKANFVGAGVTEKSVLFSYLANWESAGRWSIELMTQKRRIYLKPLETISVQQKDSVSIEPHPFDDSLDKKFKPGVFKQLQDFLNDGGVCCSLPDHIFNTSTIYSVMIYG